MGAVYELTQVKAVIEDVVNLDKTQTAADVEDMIKVLPFIAEKCQSTFSDNDMMNSFTDWVKKQMANEKVFFLHVAESLLINGGDIRSKYEDMVGFYKKGDFFNMGLGMGEILSEAAL